MNLSLALSVAGWLSFALALVMLRTPSPLLLVLFPAHFLLCLAAFFPEARDRRVLAANAATLAAAFAFLYKQTFLS